MILELEVLVGIEGIVGIGKLAFYNIKVELGISDLVWAVGIVVRKSLDFVIGDILVVFVGLLNFCTLVVLLIVAVPE